MKTGFYNPEKAKEEEEQKNLLKEEDSVRTLYLDKLRKDKRFKKYVVEDILKRNIESLTDTRKIVDMAGKGKEALADLILANVKASKTLENILNNLL